MDISQALLTLETKEIQTSFLLLAQICLYLFLWENIFLECIMFMDIQYLAEKETLICKQ